MINKLFQFSNQFKLLGFYSNIRYKFLNNNVAILAYHRVNDKNDNWSLNCLKLESFQRHIKFITKDYNIISLDELSDKIKKRKSFNEKTIVITFDDGYKDNFTNAYPILKKNNIPATIFLTTNPIENDKILWNDLVGYLIYHTNLSNLEIKGLGSYYIESENEKINAISNIKKILKQCEEKEKLSWIEKLKKECDVEIHGRIANQLMLSWDEIIEMDKNGINFGAHTVNHPILTNLDLKQAKWNIRESKLLIQEKLGKTINSFAYPNGSYNSHIKKIVSECGFKCAVSLNKRLINPTEEDIYSLSRIDAFEDMNLLKLFLVGYGKYYDYFQ